jgi:hypothetical protein
VIWSDNGMALLMAPAMTEVCCHWEKDFENVFDYLDNFSFRPCDWFIPSVKHLVFALEQVPEQFSIGSYYWTSDSYDKFTKMVLIVSGLGSGTFMPYNPSNNYRVRAFRFVMY